MAGVAGLPQGEGTVLGCAAGAGSGFQMTPPAEVESLQLDAGVGGFELPVGLGVMLVGACCGGPAMR
jgi:hypothetical protein